MLRLLLLTLILPLCSRADEGGVSFWLPGQIGSFAATLSDPGWSIPVTYYHSNANASDTKNFQFNTQVTAGLESQTDFMLVAPTYTFQDPVWGGQFALSLTAVIGGSDVAADAAINIQGNTFSGHKSDYSAGVGDLYPMASLKWNTGLHSFMTYGLLGVPVGKYDSNRLANIGIGHAAIDVGGAYTFLNSKFGTEASLTLGVTFNFENTHTNYQNGTDIHLDGAIAQFFSEDFFAGFVGYYYGQLSADSGSGNLLKNYSSSVTGFGPQLGEFFKVGTKKWLGSVKGYSEFASYDRPYGWNFWVSLAIPL